MRTLLVALAIAATGASARAERTTLRATAEIEVVDVEGAGGFANREPGLIHPRQRAPYVALDKATLDLRYAVDPHVQARLELRADADRARVDRVYLESVAIDNPCWWLRIEAGRQKPMQRPPPRRTETYSPLGGLFWRGREWHLGAHAARRLGPVTLDAIASVAMMRDLGDQPMGEDLALPSIAFVDTAIREDSEVELGGLAGGAVHGVYTAAFAFRGRLLDNDGPDRLQRTFPDDYELLGDSSSRAERWFGGRVGYVRYGVHALAEGIRQRLGLLERRGYEVGASYRFELRAGGRRIEIEPLVRHGRITTTNLPERYLIPESWDRRQTLVAVLVRPSRSLEVKVEYLLLRERTGTSAEGLRGVEDDQLLVQLRIDSELVP